MPSDNLTAVSICSGIGGLDLGVCAAFGARTVAYVEREAFAQAVLMARMENETLEPAPIFLDVVRFDGKPFRGLVDIVFGGIPCQPHSTAGKQGRQADDRDLVDEFLRIVGEVEPRFAVVENVRGFLAGDGLGRLLGGLADLGFDAEWEVVSAAQVGAPHRRARVFVLAYRPDIGHERAGAPRGRRDGPADRFGNLADPQCSPSQRWGEPGELRGEAPRVEGKGDQRERGGRAADASGEGMAYAGRPNEGRREDPIGSAERRDAAQRHGGALAWPPGPSGDWSGVPGWFYPEIPNAASGEQGSSRSGEAPRRATQGNAPEPRLCGVADELPAQLELAMRYRTDRLRALGNAVVPLQAETALRALISRTSC